MIIRMRRAAASAAALLSCLLVCAPAPPAAAASPTASSSADRYAAIDAYVRDRMAATGIPGLSYAVVGPDGPRHHRSWGTDGNGERVTAATPFLWGSVAKPITASSVLVLVQDGRLDLDDRVVDHLPDFRFGGEAHASKVTVRHLLQQTAGIPETDTLALTDCVRADCPRPAARLGALDDVRPLGPPGSVYAYASANYLVLSAVVESVTGSPVGDHLRRSVLDPAGMGGAIADQASARTRGLPPGHQLLWGAPAAIADGVDDSGAGYGYVGGDLTDLAAFASFQLRSGTTSGGDAVLSRDSVRLMREEGVLRPGGDGTGYGLGWRVGGLDAPLDNAVWHTGATPGYSAMVFLLPEQDTALVLHQNLHGLLHDEAVMQAGFGAARILADGRTPSEDTGSTAVYTAAVWGATALAVLLVLAAGRAVLLLLRAPTPPVSPLRRFTPTALWCLAGLAPWLVLAPAVAVMGMAPMLTWVPDVFTAVCVAAAAGGATIALRLVLAVRASRPASRPRS